MHNNTDNNMGYMGVMNGMTYMGDMNGITSMCILSDSEDDSDDLIKKMSNIPTFPKKFTETHPIYDILFQTQLPPTISNIIFHYTIDKPWYNEKCCCCGFNEDHSNPCEKCLRKGLLHKKKECTRASFDNNYYFWCNDHALMYNEFDGSDISEYNMSCYYCTKNNKD